MKIRMTRYYGDGKVTKSVVEIDGTDFSCEAREPSFKDYTASFPGCSQYCLPVGEFLCKPMATEQSPMALTVMKAAGHRSCRFVYDVIHQTRMNSVVLGMADRNIPPEEREITDSTDTFEAFQQYVYHAYAQEEEMRLEIKNELTNTHDYGTSI